MKSIPVVKLLESPVLLAPEKGITLFETIFEALKAEPTVEVDFKGYQFISSSFLNNAFGKLYLELDLSKEDFEKRVKFTGLSEDDFDDLMISLENAETRRVLKSQGVDLVKHYREFIPH